MADIKFRKYIAEDATTFKALNVEWLELYFEVEPIDERVLSNPQTEILDPGGHILMAELGGKTMGTFAFIKKGEGLYEFSKMAIDPKHRGLGYGNIMMQFAIAFAEKHHWDKIILYSSTILKNALHLYHKYGFIEVPMEPDIIYSRGNIKMELNF
ncbi:GNAT family N-acetyltransferase [Flavobacteriaceae bacterium]|jgi:ribosomal protein S18 acetylase RimI-like enzyme|nr:GNAT family N-acetyltransferase [Flavobacteriaceae bacterium]